MGCYWLVVAAGAKAGAAEAVLSLGGVFVDDFESADGGVDASFDEDEVEPAAASNDFESDSFEPGALESDSFKSDPFSPARA